MVTSTDFRDLAVRQPSAPLPLACAVLIVPACVLGPAEEGAVAPIDDVRISVSSMSIDGAGPCVWPVTRSDAPISSWSLGYYPVASESIHEYSEFSHWCWPVIAARSFQSLQATGVEDAADYHAAYRLEEEAIVTAGSAAGFSAHLWAELVAREAPADRERDAPVLMLIFGSPAAPGVGVVREDIPGAAGGRRVVVVWVTDPSDLAWRNWHPAGGDRQQACVPYEGADPCQDEPGAFDAHTGYDAVDLDRVIDLASRDQDLGWARRSALFLERRRPVSEREPNNGAPVATTIRDRDLVRGQIGTPGDEDWFRFHLEGSQTVRLEISDGLGDCPFDSVLALHPSAAVVPGDANCSHPGNALECDDDAGLSTCSLLEYRAVEAGEYLVRLVSYGRRETGAYVMSVSVF